MKLEIDEYFEELKHSILEEASNWEADGSNPLAYKENAFTSLVVDGLSERAILESPTVCYHEFIKGNLVAKINAFSLPDEDTKLDVVITDYHAANEIEKINASEIEKRFAQATRFLQAALSDGKDSIDPSSEAFSMMRQIGEAKKNIDRVNIILISNAISVVRKDVISKKELGNITVYQEVYDLERLRRINSEVSSQEPITINFDEGIPCVTYESSQNGYATSVAILQGQILHDLYDMYGSRLLELNVRSYLQARGKINQGILQTILTEPERFLTYNNGITVVAEGIEFNDDKTRILSLTGMQIVNGGQTTASIHRAVKHLKTLVSNVYVQAKITIVPIDEFDEVVPLISKYSNAQNKVSDVDLGANNPFQIGFERVSKKVWAPGETSMWFYERTRMRYETERSKERTKQQKAKFDSKYPKNQRLVKEDIARYCNIWNGLPQVVSKGGQKNFIRFMDSLPKDIGKDWEPSIEEYKSYISKAIFYREIASIAKDIYKIPAFRIFIVNYTAALIVEKTAKRINLEEIWNRQCLNETTREVAIEWMPKIRDIMLQVAGAREPSTVFKEDSCWKKVLEETKNWKFSNEFNGSLTTLSSGQDGGGVDTQNNMARCLQLSAQEWFDVAQWGKQSGVFEIWQCGIANTLSSYALQNWEKKPSEKQAKHGVDMIKKFAERTNGDN